MVLIHNGTIVSSAGTTQADVLIDGDRIAGVGPADVMQSLIPNLQSRTGLPPIANLINMQVIDATGLLIYPGLIDVHTHMRQPGGEHKEDFYTGTCAALAGGVTTIFAMPNTTPAVTDRATLDLVLGLAQQNAVCDYGLFLGATNTNQRTKMENTDLRECGLKMYMGSSTGDLLVQDFDAQYEHFLHYPHERIIGVHAEHEPAVRYFGAHGERRPHICAEVETARAVAMAEKVGRRVHVCHVSSRREVEIIRDAKARGVPVTCEYAPHYLFFTTDYEYGTAHPTPPEPALLDPASLYVMNPPLREESDREALWANLDVADCIATDHAPHTLEEKRSAKPPSGVTGLETMLPLLLTAASDGRLSYSDIARLCCEGPAQTFNIPLKGRIAAGYEADITLVDPNAQWVIGEQPLFTKCGWTPFDGFPVRGAVKQVFVRGQLAFSEGRITALRGSGKRVEN